MRTSKFLLAAGFCTLFCAHPAGAQPPKPAKPAGSGTAAPTGAIKKLASVEGITEYEMANGMRVLLFPDPSKPTVTVNITYKVGSRMEGYGESGMAHLLEHMVFKGTPKHPNIPQELTSHGAQANGTTWYDRTNYYETVAATDENLNWALDLEADRMINSYIAQKDLQSEFTVVRNEFESGENSPSDVLMERILSTAYLWHNYGKSTIGSKEDIERVPIENLQAFYKKYYQPDNAVLLVAGKIDEAKTLGLIQKYFGVIPRPKRILQPDYTVEPAQDGERFVELRRSGDVQSLACAFHIAPGAHPDYVAIDILNEVLTDEPTGRLYQAIVKTGLASSVSGYAAGLHDPGFLYLAADVLKEKSLDSARTAFYATLNDVTKKPVTAEEVERARTKLMKSYEQVARNSQRVGIILSEFIGMGDWRLGFLYRDNLKKVTVDDVNRAAANYLMVSNRTSGLFIPTGNAQRTAMPPTPEVVKLVEGYKGEAPIAQGEAFDATPANIEKRTERGELVGGAKYALLSKTTRGNTVEARMTLRLGDEGSLQNKSAVSELTADMLMRGSQTMTMAQINERLDKLSSTVRIGGGGQNVGITITTTRENLLPTLDLIDEILHKPAFPEAEFKTLKDEYVAAYEAERSEPQALASREFGRALNTFPKGHPLYQASLDEELAAVKAVTLEDVKKFYADYYNGSSATAGFVGDFDATQVKEKLAKVLGNWSAIKSYTRIANPYKPVQVQNREFKTPDKKNAMFLAGMPVQIRDDNPDFAAVYMGNFMFGGGFLNSRLATRIRQKEGISYGVGSQFSAGPLDDNGAFVSYAIYNPQEKGRLEMAWKEELARALADGFTAEELQGARSGALQSRQVARANDAQLAGTLNSMLEYGRTMAFSQGIDDRISSLTLAEINAAMKKHLDPTKVVFVKAGDFKE